MRCFYALFVLSLILMASTCRDGDKPEIEPKTDTLLIDTTKVGITNDSTQLLEKEAEENTAQNDSIGNSPWIHDDISPPPETPWWSIDTSNLSGCEQWLWTKMQTMYPNGEDNYWDYRVYSLLDEPSENIKNNSFINSYIHFFSNEVYSDLCTNGEYQCHEVTEEFFLNTLGEPTFKTHANSETVNYFYIFKTKFRRGPCPYIKYPNSHGYPPHFSYCSHMNVKFRNGKMFYISFFGL